MGAAPEAARDRRGPERGRTRAARPGAISKCKLLRGRHCSPQGAVPRVLTARVLPVEAARNRLTPPAGDARMKPRCRRIPTGTYPSMPNTAPDTLRAVLPRQLQNPLPLWPNPARATIRVRAAPFPSPVMLNEPRGAENRWLADSFGAARKAISPLLYCCHSRRVDEHGRNRTCSSVGSILAPALARPHADAEENRRGASRRMPAFQPRERAHTPGRRRGRSRARPEC